MRRTVAVVAAAVLLMEAVGFVVVNGILATFVDGQDMSLAGMDPDAMVTGTWAMGIVFGLYLAACAVVALLAGVRDRAPGRFGRILLITAAVTHGVLGALTVGLVGWSAFAFMMVVLALIVLVLVSFGGERTPRDAQPAPQAGPAPTNGAAPA
ncbi:hypothetical protein OG317_23260 [Streptomyces sp. NBC_01167]|uniref:hypothetical protein n=1 Tax=Streptomyces sp. NBC_01167 TaxID=2903756 RepID=UPI0038639D88|nr:hypothetical protein OG317_23260 [Streptomyces sp. NBC_01167]